MCSEFAQGIGQPHQVSVVSGIADVEVTSQEWRPADRGSVSPDDDESHSSPYEDSEGTEWVEWTLDRLRRPASRNTRVPSHSTTACRALCPGVMRRRSWMSVRSTPSPGRGTASTFRPQ